MKNRTSSSISFAPLLLLAISCSKNEPSSSTADGDAGPDPLCKESSDCSSKELCFNDGSCAPPWGSTFEMTDCEFDGPLKDNFPNCSVECTRVDSTTGAAQWVFDPQKWDECISENRTGTSKNANIRVNCVFYPKANGVQCPELDPSASFCLSDQCGGFNMSHYRSERPVLLRNSAGYTLKFKLRPIN